MAINVTNASANIDDSTLSYTIYFTGRTTTSSSGYVVGEILSGGVTIKAIASSTATASIAVTYTKAELYAGIVGRSRSGTISFKVSEFSIYDDPLTFDSTTGGSVNITARLSSISMSSPTTASPINMDAASPRLTMSWARPSSSSAFYARLKLYVGNSSGGASTSWTQIFSRYGFTTSTNGDLSNMNGDNYVPSIISAMAGASPKDIRVDVITQFNDGTGDYEDLSGSSSVYAYSGVIKSFVVLSTVSSTVALNIDLNATLAVNLSVTYAYYSHNVHLEFYNAANAWETLETFSVAPGVYSVTYTLTQAQVNNICADFPTTDTLTNRIRVRLQTYQSAGQVTYLGETSKTGTGTITNCTPTWTSTTVYVEDVGGIIRTLTGGTSYLTTLLQNKSTATVTFGAIKTLKYATPVSYAIGFGTPVVKTSPGGVAGANGDYTESAITQALSAAQLNYSGNQTVNITITDSRGKTSQQSITFIILPYTAPNLQSFNFYRNGYTTQIYLELKLDIQSIMVGAVERNGNDTGDIQYKLASGGTWTNVTTIAGSTASGRITYTFTLVNVGTLALDTTGDYYLQFRDDVNTTYVASSPTFITVGKAVPSFSIGETASYINGSLIPTLNLIYPVGSIYMSVASTSPATLFGGTWVALSDVFLLASGAKVAGATGGEENHILTGPELAAHVHTGTVDAGGVHRHNSQGYFTFNAAAGTKNSMARSRIGSDPVDDSSILDSASHTHTFTTAVAGSNAAHNNMPPYLSVYMWKRTA